MFLYTLHVLNWMAQDSLTLEGETCPVCFKKTLTLAEHAVEVPYFGVVHVFGMSCSSCGYRKSDLEAEEAKDPAKYTLDVASKEDLDIRVVKSSEAVVKIPHVGSIEPGDASEGYVTNVQGIVERIKTQVESVKNLEDDAAVKKKCKNMLKKIHKMLSGSSPFKLIIEDKTGNSAIISDKAVRSKIKK